MAQPSANDLYRAARVLAKSGQPVFPCHTQGERAKRPMTKNGFKDASTDPEQIKRWWQAHRSAAIGIPTGIKWDVLDVDVKNDVDGRVHLPELKRLGLLNGCKRVARTPSGGWHLFFTPSPRLTNKVRSASLGLDVRSTGGYILAAPSFIDTGDYEGAYEDHGETTGSTDEPLMWDLIVSVLEPRDEQTGKVIALLPSERRASLASLREWVSHLKEGERNNGMFWAVSRCIENGLDPHELVEPAMLTGLREEEIEKSINSALFRAGVSVHELQTEAEALFPD